MYLSFIILLTTAAVLFPECYGNADDILEINVDGTTGYLRGKRLTTIGRNEKSFITFRNIPFALEPERFMVYLSVLYENYKITFKLLVTSVFVLSKELYLYA